MSNFTHSIVLFTGDDGLPLEFNVRNTNDKVLLKELIEHGGGFCTQNENAVHLISPGTKVLNVDAGKKLVSSTYIHDCVKENYLLDVNDYVFVISESQTSDISDEDSEKLLAVRHSTCKSPKKSPLKSMEITMSPIKSFNKSNETGSTTASNLTSESFVESSQNVTSQYKIVSRVYAGNEVISSPKSSEIQKSSKQLSEWQLNDFEEASSMSLVSLPKSSHTDKDMSLCSSLLVQPSTSSGGRAFTISSDSSPSIQKSPLKPVCSKAKFSPKIPNQCEDQQSSVSQENSSMEIDDIIFNSNPKKVLFTVSPNKSVQNSNASQSKQMCATSMEIHESIDKNMDKSFSLSPNKSQSDKEKSLICIEKSDYRTLKTPNTRVVTPENSTRYSITNEVNIRSPIIDEIFLKSPKSKYQTVRSPNSIGKTVMSPNVKEVTLRSPNVHVLKSPKQATNMSISPVRSETPNVTPFKKNLQSVLNPSPVQVSSSQEDDLDKFDDMILSKVQKKTPVQEEDSLSQSYTVSSSADAQPASLPNSADTIQAETQNNPAAPLPDSPSLNANQINIQMYLKDLEAEVEEILLKGPLTIQDKTTLVKYVCLARNLPPSSVLESLFSDCLEI